MASQIPGNLEVQARIPLDNKYWVSTVSDLNTGLTFQGLLRFTKTDEKLWLKLNSKWVQIPTVDDLSNVQVDLSKYYTKTQVDSLFNSLPKVVDSLVSNSSVNAPSIRAVNDAISRINSGGNSSNSVVNLSSATFTVTNLSPFTITQGKDQSGTTVSLTDATWFGDVNVRGELGKSSSLSHGLGYTYTKGQLTILAQDDSSDNVQVGSVVEFSYAITSMASGNNFSPILSSEVGQDAQGIVGINNARDAILWLANNRCCNGSTAYSITLSKNTQTTDGVSFASGNSNTGNETISFNLISGTSGPTISIAITSNGATSYIDYASEYAGKPYSFKNNQGTLFNGVFPSDDNLNITY